MLRCLECNDPLPALRVAGYCHDCENAYSEIMADPDGIADENDGDAWKDDE